MALDLKSLTNKLRMRHFWVSHIYRLFIYVLLFDLVFIFLFPFLYMVITSLKSPVDLMDVSVQWIPRGIHFRNYKMGYNALNFPVGFRNSTMVTTLSVLGHLLSCSFVAYGFARFRFPGRKILFMVVILSLIIPIQSIIIPMYINYVRIGWVGSYLPLIVPTFFGFGLKGGLFIFIFRQFFVGLPYELEDAARIDGCGTFKTFFRIVLPISKSAILVSTVLSMVWHWNDYFEPIVYLNKQKDWLLPQMLPSMYAVLKMIEQDMTLAMDMADLQMTFNEAIVMAGTVLVILPLLIAYLLLQRHFMQGIERTGLVE